MSEDWLTGLHDRHTFQAALRRMVGEANEKQYSVALLLVDVKGFSSLNRIHGHEFGDNALRHLALQLRQVARANDVVARIGDDQFAMILPRLMNLGHAELAVQKIARLLEPGFESGGERTKLAVTVVAALCPTHASQAEHLFQLAESTLVAAKSTGQQFLSPLEHSDAASVSEHWDIEDELDYAVQRGEMKMYYQPKIRCSDRMPLGAEALMRWDSPARGRISPDLFIPIAERTGRIKALTVWAINSALRHASEWPDHFGDLSVSVNVPAELVAQHELPDLVENAISIWGGDHAQLILEITERSLVASPEHSFKILSRIRDLGVKVSIDDFGTGYSCLAYFKNIPADELKIDKFFVSALCNDPASVVITRLIIDLAHRFDMSVASEGIEDEQTLSKLVELGCDVAQGFLFGQAMSSAEFVRWLAARHASLNGSSSPEQEAADESQPRGAGGEEP